MVKKFTKLKICGQINQSCNQIMKNPMSWLKKFETLSKENLKDWKKILKKVKNDDKEKIIIPYLKWNLEYLKLIPNALRNYHNFYLNLTEFDTKFGKE